MSLTYAIHRREIEPCRSPLKPRFTSDKHGIEHERKSHVVTVGYIRQQTMDDP